MSKEGKQYGLIMPKKVALSAPRVGNVFGDDNDSENEDGVDWVKKALKGEEQKNRIKKQTKLNIHKALAEDPTIYQYDEIYDELEKKKEQEKVVEKKEAKKPKYIHNLLKAAERRKREQEHRVERMVQKEREAEGEMYADKESFVTSAYRAKLEEFRKMEEEEVRMDRLEAIGDVTKQPDISGFYRQFYAQTVDKKSNEDDKDGNNDIDDKCKSLEVFDGKNVDEDEKLSTSGDSRSSSEQDSNEASEGDASKRQNNKKMCSRSAALNTRKTRQYRKRNIQSSNSETESDDDREGNNDKNHDDSNYKNRSHLHSDNHDNMNDAKKIDSPRKKSRASSNRNREDEDKHEKRSKPNTENDVLEFKKPEGKVNESFKPEKSNELKDVTDDKAETKKISIWEKRTIGAVYEAALQRYYARKAIKLSSS